MYFYELAKYMYTSDGNVLYFAIFCLYICNVFEIVRGQFYDTI